MDKNQIDDLIDEIENNIHAACNDSISKKSPGVAPKPPWWTDDLEARKREVIDLHRRLHDAKKHSLPTESLCEELKTHKKKYADELRDASSSNFRDLCERQTKENVWSLTNRVLKDYNPRRPPTTFKIDNKYTIGNEETARTLLNNFYPDDTPDTLERHYEPRQRLLDLPDTPVPRV